MPTALLMVILKIGSCYLIIKECFLQIVSIVEEDVRGSFD